MLFPFAPLYERLLLDGEEKISDKEIGHRLGVSETVGRRLRKTGVMTEYEADRFVTRGLGLHVTAVAEYRELWISVPDDVLEERAQEAEARLQRKTRQKAVA